MICRVVGFEPAIGSHENFVRVEIPGFVPADLVLLWPDYVFSPEMEFTVSLSIDLNNFEL
jgi:hypothetical protein